MQTTNESSIKFFNRSKAVQNQNTAKRECHRTARGKSGSQAMVVIRGPMSRGTQGNSESRSQEVINRVESKRLKG